MNGNFKTVCFVACVNINHEPNKSLILITGF